MTYDTVFEFFVQHWWHSIAFHLAMYMPIWLTKAGHWSQLWAGGR